MSSKHFDIAIIGGSLAARIAASLLAKQGSKVLLLLQSEARVSTWLHSSLFLEKLLGTLGGRACFVAQKPIQVLSRKARVTLNNDISLDKELCREFSRDGSAVSHWLENLRLQGMQLEELFWENGGLPWPSFKAATRFKLLCMRRSISRAQFDEPLTKSLEQLPLPTTAFVRDLLQGLTLKRTNHLSRAQSSMAWAQAMRPENLKEPDFSDLLSKRFDQFHGLKADLADLEYIEFNNSRWIGGRLKEEGQFTADTFLLGDASCIDRFSSGKIDALPLPHTVVEQTTSFLNGQLSPLLASRVICGGDMPLRLAIEENGDELYGQILGTGEATEQQLRELLAPALPFAKYDITNEVEKPAPITNQRQQLNGLPLRIGSNLYCADSNLLLPELGAPGAALLGWSLAENLASKRKQG